jgi:hypothetical protein
MRQHHTLYPAGRSTRFAATTLRRTHPVTESKICVRVCTRTVIQTENEHHTETSTLLVITTFNPLMSILCLPFVLPSDFFHVSFPSWHYGVTFPTEGGPTTMAALKDKPPTASIKDEEPHEGFDSDSDEDDEAK